MTRNLLIASAALAAGLAGCATPHQQAAFTKDPLTPTEQYAIQVSQTPDQLALAPHREGLSPRQQSALSDFASRWRAMDGGQVVVRAPASDADSGAAQASAEAAADFLHHLGVPSAELRVAAYEGGAGAPVLVSFMTYEAHGPDCASNWDNLTSTGANKPSHHFGCAVTANFAAQIANPKDLVTTATLDPADNTRRAVIFDKYRKGQTTSSAKDSQANGAVSTAVQ
jgi:pilus assembly protein CpaD